VLRKIFPLVGKDHSKWAPNYKSPYVVKKKFSERALLLTRMDGNDLPRLVNSYFVKKYYVFDQRFRVKRKTWKDPLSQFLKVKVFDNISYNERITKEDEKT